MKKMAMNKVLCMQPVPQTIVSCRDSQGRNNALVVGFVANASLNPAMVMVGRYAEPQTEASEEQPKQ